MNVSGVKCCLMSNSGKQNGQTGSQFFPSIVLQIFWASKGKVLFRQQMQGFDIGYDFIVAIYQ